MAGTFWRPRCGTQNAIWQSDFTFDDCVDMKVKGLVTYYSCAECGSEIEVRTEDNANGKEQ